MELVIATNNAGKLQEIKALLPAYTLLTLKDIGFQDAIPEPYETFAENAWIKAKTIHDFCNKPVMADDSGLCVDALQGAPGVFSARYAGEHASDAQNVQKLLVEMNGQSDRAAHYAAVICLIINGTTHYFEGHCHGNLTLEPIGNLGFGYDPVFQPVGYEQTFSELPLSVKNRMSHRGEAIQKMVHFLQDFS